MPLSEDCQGCRTGGALAVRRNGSAVSDGLSDWIAGLPVIAAEVPGVLAGVNGWRAGVCG